MEDNNFELTAVAREQVAAQIVAIMQALFARPNPDQMRELLQLADGQIAACEHNLTDSTPATFRSM